MSALGVPFDRGGAWIHSAAINPLAPLAAKAGFTIHHQNLQVCRAHIGGRKLEASEVRAYDDYLGDMWTAIEEAAADGRDVAASEVLPQSPWREAAQHWISMYDAVDADQASTGDRAGYEHADEDWLLAEGLGALIAHLGAQVPVQLNCPATSVDWTGPRVAVTTPEGKVETDAVVVTVSTGVLAAGRIGFTPGLPDDKLQAIADLPMGLLNKVAFLFDAAHLGVADGEFADYHAGGAQFCNFALRLCGSDLSVGFVAGRFGQDLEAQGPGAATAFCIEGLRALFGTHITRQVRGTDEVGWMSNPLTMGSYSATRPGRAGARAVLAEPLDGRIFFAGEATNPRAYATVHGAHLSGCEAATAILAQAT
jgi:monoamine oxidase